ncbi:MAG: hypothetical protein KDE54_03595 [Caldilineaceae bacterium]|nr:hypothetical protein [Caldilineaceae bacterium]
MAADAQQPLALVVFLENVGHISGLNLPAWLMNVIDFVTEEYAKILLRLYGAYRRYDKVIILEDAQATGPNLSTALVEASQTHVVDVLLLVHGYTDCLVGYKARERVGRETFAPLLAAYQRDPSLLNLRMVYGVNCYGASLAPLWTALGAQAVNGAIGVNWMPEPSLTIFLRNWLTGAAYSTAVERSNLGAMRFWRRLLKPQADGSDHAAIASSRQIVFGQRDVRIHH